MYKNSLIVFILIFSITTFFSCNSEESQSSLPEENETVDNNAPSLFKIEDKLFSIPSPFQVTELFKKEKIPYSPSLLNPVSNLSNYTTSYKQALNLGVYGANLGYLNMNEQIQGAAKYFAAVRTLSQDLGIMNTFNEKLIKRIEANSTNKDSMIFIISTAFRNADSYLMDNKRSDVSVLILAGGWIESVYYLTQTYKETENSEIINRIGEQKHPLINLIELLRPYYSQQSDEFDDFLVQLVDLATIFDGVQIQYEYKEPEIDEENKLTTIKSKTTVVINEYQLEAISEAITNLRTKIIE